MPQNRGIKQSNPQIERIISGVDMAVNFRVEKKPPSGLVTVTGGINNSKI